MWVFSGVFGFPGPRPILELRVQARLSGWRDFRSVRVMVFSDRLVVASGSGSLGRGTRFGGARGRGIVIPYRSITGIALNKKLFLKWVTIRFVDESGEEKVLDIVGRRIDELYETINNILHM